MADGWLSFLLLFMDVCPYLAIPTTTNSVSTTATPHPTTGVFRPSIIDDDEGRLTRDLFAGYNPKLRPVFHKRENVTVVLGMSVHQIIDVYEKDQIIKTSFWVRQIWYNPFLRWNETFYGGIKEINVSPLQVWTPDLVLYNNADASTDGSLENFKTRIIVSSDGKNMWLAPVIFSSSCTIKIKYFPFDDQYCSLKFGSWTFDGFHLDLKPEAPQASLSKFIPNGEWDLIGAPAIRNVLRYDCCPAPYPDVTFTLHLRRRVLFFLFNLIIPCFVIVVLTSLSFYLPPDSGERISVVITNLLAMTVFMLMVADILPPTSDEVSIISIFYSCSIIEVGIALLGTCIVLKYHFCSTSIHKMPPWVRFLVIECLGKVFCRQEHTNDQEDSKSDTIKLDNCKHKLENGLKDPLIKQCNFFGKFGVRERVRSSGMKTTDGGSNLSMTQDDEGRGRGGTPYSSHRNMDDIIAAEASSNSTVFALLSRQESMVKNLEILAHAQRCQDEEDREKNEWKLAASILDNFFCWLFLMSIFISSIVLYVRVTEAHSVNSS
ncbi:predicted protein [Nematostella vectensis]|uniref:Uncharacterized protein n=2 Tax=Nematostella vectensis TaxID=45351 RepID=A7S2N9_NEMVE|nr:predicted protein [Nematostella vectensis]|eukprot:XP_001634101.1 predicted protein [Nematostella vectensis]